MQTALNIAENATTIFITIDKLQQPAQAEQALSLLRRLYFEFGMANIPFVSDEEQEELEALLNAQSEEDKEIAFVEYETIDLP